MRRQVRDADARPFATARVLVAGWPGDRFARDGVVVEVESGERWFVCEAAGLAVRMGEPLVEHRLLVADWLRVGATLELTVEGPGGVGELVLNYGIVTRIWVDRLGTGR